MFGVATGVPERAAPAQDRYGRCRVARIPGGLDLCRSRPRLRRWWPPDPSAQGRAGVGQVQRGRGRVVEVVAPRAAGHMRASLQPGVAVPAQQAAHEHGVRVVVNEDAERSRGATGIRQKRAAGWGASKTRATGTRDRIEPVRRLLLLTGSIRQGARVGRYRPGLHLHQRNRVYLWHEYYRHSDMVRVGSRCQVQPGDEPERLPLPVTIESDAKHPWNDPYAATQKPT